MYILFILLSQGCAEGCVWKARALRAALSASFHHCLWINDGFYGQSVGVEAEAADYAFAGGGDAGVVAKLFALVYVGDVYFDDGELHAADGIVKGYRRVGIGSCVEHHAVNVFCYGLLQTVDEKAFYVALEIEKFHLRIALAELVEATVHRAVAVDARLALSEQVEVGAVENQNFHR